MYSIMCYNFMASIIEQCTWIRKNEHIYNDSCSTLLYFNIALYNLYTSFLVGEELSYDEHELLYECEFNYIFYKTKTVQMKRNEAKIS